MDDIRYRVFNIKWSSDGPDNFVTEDRFTVENARSEHQANIHYDLSDQLWEKYKLEFESFEFEEISQ